MNYETAPVFPMSQQVYTLVEMPCIVRDANKAIEMLGGTSAVEKIANNEHKFLELRFRGPMSHAVYGDKQSTNNILLRLRRNKKDRKNFKFEIIGKIVNSIHFQGMVDFQYIQDDIFDASKTSKFSEAETARLLQDKDSTVGQKEKLNLAPPIFSRFDIPLDYEFRANPLSTMVSVTRDDGTVIFKRQLKKYGTRQMQVCQISFSDEVPTGPDPNLEPVQFQDDEDRTELMNAIRELFDRRPIWSRRALEAQFESKKLKSHVRYILPHFAFYYKDGPWRKLWVKYGVNPRKDKSTAIYQMLDFRVPSEFKNQVLQFRRKKGLVAENVEYGSGDMLRRAPKRKQAVHEDLRSIMYSTETHANKSSAQQQEVEENELEEDEATASKVDLESYLFISIPSQQSTVYQLCDIRLRSVQEIIKVENPRKQIVVDDAELNNVKKRLKRKNNDQYNFGTRTITLRNEECHPKYGWYTNDALEQIRYLMKKKIEQWIEHGNEEDDEDIVGIEEDIDANNIATQPQRQEQEEEGNEEGDEAVHSNNLLLTE